MSMLYVSYANSGDAWAMVDSTPPQRLYFRCSGDIHEYAVAHRAAIRHLDVQDFHDREAALFGGVLALDDGPNWPLWDGLKDEAFQKYLDVHGGGDWEF
jgi:hypothetical protein